VFEWNLGGYEHRTEIEGNDNEVEIQASANRQGQETLFGKVGLI
jgi:hypothetical protein